MCSAPEGCMPDKIRIPRTVAGGAHRFKRFTGRPLMTTLSRAFHAGLMQLCFTVDAGNGSGQESINLKRRKSRMKNNIIAGAVLAAALAAGNVLAADKDAAAEAYPRFSHPR